MILQKGKREGKYNKERANMRDKYYLAEMLFDKELAILVMSDEWENERFSCKLFKEPEEENKDEDVFYH